MNRCSLIALAAVVLTGCSVMVVDPGESTGSEEDALSTANALTANALTANALTANALTANALTANALTANAMSPLVYSALRDPSDTGTLTRLHFKYVVSCALEASQSFSFTWTDAAGVSRPTTYPGSLGIAPTWSQKALGLDDQRMVSACVAARTNWYGVSVSLSVRSATAPLKTTPNSPELASYPNIEGAFWGNLFSASPYIHACYKTGSVDHSRQLSRDCAAGHVSLDPVTQAQTIDECGIIDILGSCESLCGNVNQSGQYYASCGDTPGGAKSKLVITTALQ